MKKKKKKGKKKKNFHPESRAFPHVIIILLRDVILELEPKKLKTPSHEKNKIIKVENFSIEN